MTTQEENIVLHDNCCYYNNNNNNFEWMKTQKQQTQKQQKQKQRFSKRRQRRGGCVVLLSSKNQLTCLLSNVIRILPVVAVVIISFILLFTENSITTTITRYRDNNNLDNNNNNNNNHHDRRHGFFYISAAATTIPQKKKTRRSKTTTKTEIITTTKENPTPSMSTTAINPIQQEQQEQQEQKQLIVVNKTYPYLYPAFGESILDVKNSYPIYDYRPSSTYTQNDLYNDQPPFLYNKDHDMNMYHNKNHHVGLGLVGLESNDNNNRMMMMTTHNYRLVQYYTYWCAKTHKMKNRFLTVSQRVQQILEQQQQLQLQQETMMINTTAGAAAPKIPPLLSIYAIECTKNRFLCRQQKIRTYPQFILYPPDVTITGIHIPPEQLEPHRIIQHLHSITSTSDSSSSTSTQEQQQQRREQKHHFFHRNINTKRSEEDPETSIAVTDDDHYDNIEEEEEEDFGNNIVEEKPYKDDDNNSDNNNVKENGELSSTSSSSSSDLWKGSWWWWLWNQVMNTIPSYFLIMNKKQNQISSSLSLSSSSQNTLLLLHRTRKEMKHDVYMALDFTLRHSTAYTMMISESSTNTTTTPDEIGINHPFDGPMDESHEKVLNELLLLLERTIPPNWIEIHNMINHLRQEYHYVIRSEQILISILDEHKQRYLQKDNHHRHDVTFTTSEHGNVLNDLDNWSPYCTRYGSTRFPHQTTTSSSSSSSSSSSTGSSSTRDTHVVNTYNQYSNGYSCSLWTLLHVVSIGLIEYNTLADTKLATDNVAKTLVDFIRYYYNCDGCSQQFVQLYQNSSSSTSSTSTSLSTNIFVTSEQLRTMNNYTEFYWMKLPLWLHQVHNDITRDIIHHDNQERLMSSSLSSSDEGYITKHNEQNVTGSIPSTISTPVVVWPRPEECSQCWIRDTSEQKTNPITSTDTTTTTTMTSSSSLSLNHTAVYQYLKLMYGSQIVDYMDDELITFKNEILKHSLALAIRRRDHNRRAVDTNSDSDSQSSNRTTRTNNNNYYNSIRTWQMLLFGLSMILTLVTIMLTVVSRLRKRRKQWLAYKKE